ncbi:hypothetical protein CLM85_29995, partial [Streptomyces albidoflavus]
AEAFREKFDDEFRPRMDEARDSGGAAATAREDGARDMKTRQAAAVRGENEADAVDKELNAARKSEDKRNEPGGGEEKGKKHEKRGREGGRDGSRARPASATSGANGLLWPTDASGPVR